MPEIHGYILLGALLFGLGVVGFLTRRNLIVMFLCVELMLQGVLLNLVGFSRLHRGYDGQAFGLLLVVFAAVEAAVTLGLVVAMFRRKGTLDADAWRTMRS